jgi:acyl carrier protein
VLGIANARWDSVRRLLPRVAEPLMAELPMAAHGEGDAGSLRAELMALSPDEAQERMVDILRQELATILRQSPESLSAEREITHLGVDSLMAVELRMALELRLGVDLPLLSLTDKPTLSRVAARVLKTVLAQNGEAAPAAERDKLADLVRQHEAIEPAEAPAQ